MLGVLVCIGEILEFGRTWRRPSGVRRTTLLSWIYGACPIIQMNEKSRVINAKICKSTTRNILLMSAFLFIRGVIDCQALVTSEKQ
jgi:hypothetical protein